MPRWVSPRFIFLFLAVLFLSGEAKAFVNFCEPWEQTIRVVLDLSPSVAEEFNAVQIDPVALVCAIIDQESDGNPRVQKFEGAFYRAHVRGNADVRRHIRRIRDRFHYPTYHQAARAFSTAYGLTQLIYASARVEGYPGDPDGLKDPVVNIFFATEHLFRKLRRAKMFHPRGNQREILLWTLRFWNGSPNREETLEYALSVEKQYAAYHRLLLGEGVTVASK